MYMLGDNPPPGTESLLLLVYTLGCMSDGHRRHGQVVTGGQCAAAQNGEGGGGEIGG